MDVCLKKCVLIINMPPKKKVVVTSKSPVNTNKFDGLHRKFATSNTLEIQPKSWVLPNRVKFIEWMRDTFNYDNIKQQAAGRFGLFPSQRFVKDFLQYASPYRGLLLYHQLGTGKSCASIVAAENLLNNMEVVLLLPASLSTNYIDEIKNKCGNHYFSVNQKWKWLDYENVVGIIGKIEEDLFIPGDYIKKAGGVWVPIKGEGSNFADFSDVDKAKINKQLDAMVRKKYSIIHYNGISRDEIRKLQPFHNKVIIIDEVHNFVSQTVGNGTRCKDLSELIYFAKNAKVILLSGTPMINYPHEVAHMISLLAGPQRMYNFAVGDTDLKALDKELSGSKIVDHYVVDAKNKKVSVRFTPDGFAFTNKAKLLVARAGDALGADGGDARAVALAEGLGIKFEGKTDYELLPREREEFDKLFIDYDNSTIKNSQMFTRRILGRVSYFGKNFADLYPRTLPPEIIFLEMSNHQFHAYEKNRLEERAKEKKAKDQKRGKKAIAEEGDLFKKSGQIYRTFSRANCNFVFPEGITRPYPSSMALMAKEVDDEDLKNEMDKQLKANKKGDDAQDGGAPKVKKGVAKKGNANGANGAKVVAEDDKVGKKDVIAYQAKLDESMEMLKSKAGVFLKQGGSVAQFAEKNAASVKEEDGNKIIIYKQFKMEEGLTQYSPKFAVLLDRVMQGKGKALVYSSFRKVEGLGILSMVLDANGWAEFKIKKDASGEWQLDIAEEDLAKPKYFQFRSGEDDVKVLMRIFNNDLENVPESIKKHFKGGNLRGEMLKLIMITQSGAEGISLKHVRQVHILEPYWNDIRVSQVIGRAVRARSHDELPKDERDVRIFKYIVKLTEKQLNEAQQIREHDDKKTTDEYIYGIAERKISIISKIQDLLKKGAVDCVVHGRYHDASLKCFGFPVNADENALTYKNLNALEDENDFQHKQKVAVRKKEVKYRECVIKGMKYVCEDKSGDVFDYEQYMKKKLLKIGRLVLNETTGKYQLVKKRGG
jgi:hypothetical protein